MLLLHSAILLLVVCLASTAPQFSPQPNLFDPIHRQENHIAPDGRYKFGFQSNVAARDEIRGDDGITRGYYAFIDDRGEMQYVFYTAGPDGFKIQAISNMKPLPQPAKSAPGPNLRYEQVGETELQQNPARSTNLNLFSGQTLAHPQQRAHFDGNPSGIQQQRPVKVAPQIMYPLDIGINLFTGQKLNNDHFLANYHNLDGKRSHLFV